MRAQSPRFAIPRATWQVAQRGLVLLVWLLVLVVIFGNGFGDAAYFAGVRNETSETLTLGDSLGGESERRLKEPLAPRAETSVGKIDGARLFASKRLVIRAYDSRGVLTFCRELEYDDYRISSAAIGIRSGDVSC